MNGSKPSDISVRVRSFGAEFLIELKAFEWDDIIKRWKGTSKQGNILNVAVHEQIACNDLVNAFSAYSDGAEWGVTNHRNYFYYLKQAVERATKAAQIATMFMGLHPIEVDGYALGTRGTHTGEFMCIMRKIAESCPDAATRAYAIEQCKEYDNFMRAFGYYEGGMEL